MKSFASSPQRVAPPQWDLRVANWATLFITERLDAMEEVYLPLSETVRGNEVLGEVMDTEDRLIHEPRMMSASDVVLCELSVLHF